MIGGKHPELDPIDWTGAWLFLPLVTIPRMRMSRRWVEGGDLVSLETGAAVHDKRLDCWGLGRQRGGLCQWGKWRCLPMASYCGT